MSKILRRYRASTRKLNDQRDFKFFIPVTTNLTTYCTITKQNSLPLKKNIQKQQMKKAYQAPMAHLNVDNDIREAALKALDIAIDDTEPAPMLGQFTKEKLHSLRANYGNSKPAETDSVMLKIS
jgi:hypothetical protein